MSRYFLTTAIDYVNGRPHLGHAYEKVLADAVARFRRSLGEEVFFLTGVDEHGQKVQQSARAKGVEPQAFCDEMSAHFGEAWKGLGISNDRFVRTTNPTHKKAVQEHLKKLHADGQIYFQEHEGFYSTRQEQFVTEKDMVDGRWPEIFGEVVQTKEPNYFFKLAQHQDWLREEFTRRTDWIVPAFRRNEVLAALEKPLNDLCISRPKSRLEWGIPLPFDEDYVTYVWFDALVNYVSFAEGRWPADLHIIGKDILIPAHAVYWPIMLKALGLPQPRQFLVHGWWQMDGEKMSKSTGNVVDPLSLVQTYGPDAFRYYVLREMAVGQDADFTLEQFAQRYKSDLGNDLGNLVNRAISMVQRYREGRVPECPLDAGLSALCMETMKEYRERMLAFETHHALDRIWRLVRRGNQYVDESAPWKLAKEPAEASKLDEVLATLVETVRVLGVLVAGVLPATAAKIATQLGLSESETLLSEAAPGARMAGRTLGKPEPLFPRIES